MQRRGILPLLTYWFRDFASPQLFRELLWCNCGDVLDVGGGGFIGAAVRAGVSYSCWTTLDPEREPTDAAQFPCHRWVQGRGESIPADDNSFDTVLCIQVLEHVPQPDAVLSEMVRVLKPGGRLLLMVPQNTSLHLMPHHYFGFTRSWLDWVGVRWGLHTKSAHALGGFWRAQSYRYAHYLLQEFAYPGKSTGAYSRNLAAVVLWPLHVFMALILLPLSMALSVGDLKDEAPNHLYVYVKPRESEFLAG